MIDDIVKSLNYWRLELEWGNGEVKINEIKGTPIFYKGGMPQLHYTRNFTDSHRIEDEHPIIFYTVGVVYAFIHPRKYSKFLKCVFTRFP